MKGKMAYHFFEALHPGEDWDTASDDMKMIMKGLADIAYEQLEKHMTSASSPLVVSNTAVANI
jgi:hypothetical protein